MNLVPKCLAIAVLAATTAFGANNIQAYAGLNLADLDMENNVEQAWSSSLGSGSTKKHFRPGFCAGAAFEIGLTDWFMLTPGLMVETRGTAFETDVTVLGTSYHGTSDIRLTYLDIPVLASLKWATGPGRLLGQAGADFGFLVGAEQHTEDSQGNEHSNNVDDSFESTDFGLSFFGGYELDLPVGFVFLKAGYYLGLLDINKSNSSGDVMNRGIRILAGYSFRL